VISLRDQRVKDLHDNYEEQRQQRVSLTEAPCVAYSPPQASIDEHLRARRSQHS
jgi:hypothetical protein